MKFSNIEQLISRQQIKERIEALALKINQDYCDKDNIVLLCVLKGAVNFFSDLSTMLDFDLKYEFIGLSSYEGTESTGRVKITTPLPNLNNKNVIIIEDITDTGVSMAYLKPWLEYSTNVNSIKVCTLLDKPSRRTVDFEPDYVGFEIDDLFVIGYGMDYNEKYRNLPFIGIYNEK
jgi:hypoxanthine phosphoribosyltransferase